jgi:pimeloyl-ACP methyl ester carboxylesterase
MPQTVKVLGLEIEYELYGKEGDPAVAITPGGRYVKEFPGLPEMAKAVAAGGRRVLLWDRPNSGGSDVCFDGAHESELQAKVLIALIKELKLGPTVLCGGSAGSRISLIAAAMDPSAVSHLVLWWISGGPIGLMLLGYVYCCGNASAAALGGMEAVAAIPEWADLIKRKPHNRDIIMAQEPKKFIDTMQRWAEVYVPSKDSPVPGMTPDDFKRCTMPALVMRSGSTDIFHLQRTSEWTAEMLPNATFVDPPWGDDEWNERVRAGRRKEGGLVDNWVKLVPMILDFTKKK